MGSYQRLITFLSRSKGKKQASWSSNLEKPPKSSKTKFVAKPSL
jgi:hypothetical protein